VVYSRQMTKCFCHKFAQVFSFFFNIYLFPPRLCEFSDANHTVGSILVPIMWMKETLSACYLHIIGPCSAAKVRAQSVFMQPHLYGRAAAAASSPGVFITLACQRG